MNSVNDFDVIRRSVQILDVLSAQTAVHRKKFEYALSQLRPTVTEILKNKGSLGESSHRLIRNLNDQFQEIQKLEKQNILQTWTNSTLDNPSNFVYDQLIKIFERIHKILSKFDPSLNLCKNISTSTEKWDQFNMYDLRAIEGSFTTCLKLSKTSDDFTEKVRKKLISIQNKLEKEAKPLVSHPMSPIPSAYQNWKVNLSDFSIIKEIGHGVSATVFLARDNRPGISNRCDVAIKRFEMTKFNGSRFQSFQREVAVLASCQHPALIGLVGMTDTNPFSIITEYMPKGSLFHDLHKNHQLDSTMKTIAAYDIARGMQYLHSRQIAHRDLKSLNVLIDKDNHARLCDFGFSRHWSDTSLMNSSIGTPHWMAPEILHRGGYTNKVDVYAYGIVLWEIVTEKLPYNNLEPKKIIELVSTKNIRPEMPKNISDELADLIKRCWHRDPEVRPSFDSIIKEFKSKKIFLPDTDLDKFFAYMSESATTTEVVEDLIEKMITDIKEKKADIRDFLRVLAEKEIPPNSVEACWEMVEEFSRTCDETSSDLCKVLLLFAKTPRFADAARILRALPRNSIPPDVAASFIKEMPTGNEEIDTSITIAACRNGQADLCALYVTNPKLVALSLDAACQSSIDPSLKYAVIDKCYTSIMKEIKEKGVLSLRCAAVRCILVGHEVRRLPMSFVLKVLTKKVPEKVPEANLPLSKSSSEKVEADEENGLAKKIDGNKLSADEDSNEDSNEVDNQSRDDLDDDDDPDDDDTINKSDLFTKSCNDYANYDVDAQTEDSLVALVLLGTATAALNGVSVPPEVVCEVLNRWPDDKRAGATMIALCKDDVAADLILQKIRDDKPSPIILSILLEAARFKNKHFLILDIMKSMDFSEVSKELSPVIDAIYDRLGVKNDNDENGN